MLCTRRLYKDSNEETGVADPNGLTAWPYSLYKAGDKAVFYGKIPTTGDYGVVYLDETGKKTVGVDTSSIADFQSFGQILGSFDNKVYFSVNTNSGPQLGYSFDGTTVALVPGLNVSDNEFYHGVEYNGAFYFRQTGLGDAGFASNQDYLFALKSGTVTPVNFGDENNPVAVFRGEPRGVFNGKLHVDGYTGDDSDRYLVAVDANGVSKVTATMDYYGTPTLRSFPYTDEVFVSGNYMYFSSQYEANGLQDAGWGSGTSAVFRMGTDGSIIRLDPTTPDPITGGNNLDERPYQFKQLGSSILFTVDVMGTSSHQIYKVEGTQIHLLQTLQSFSMGWNTAIYDGKLYIPSQGPLDYNDRNTRGPSQLGTLDEAGNYTVIFSNTGYNRNGSVLAFNGGLLYNKPDADPRTKDDLWFMKGTENYKIEGVRDVDFSEGAIALGNRLYFPGYLVTDPESQDWSRLIYIELPAAPTVDPVVDPDSPALTTLTETKDVAGSKGSVTFPDGSGFDLDAKGRLYSKVKSKFLVQAAGSFTVTYKVGSKNKTFTCKIATYGSIKKLKKAPTKATLYKTKKACQLPKDAIAALKVGVVTFKHNVVVKRYYATTAKAKTPAGQIVRPLTRKMTVRMGKLH